MNVKKFYFPEKSSNNSSQTSSTIKILLKLYASSSPKCTIYSCAETARHDPRTQTNVGQNLNFPPHHIAPLLHTISIHAARFSFITGILRILRARHHLAISCRALWARSLNKKNITSMEFLPKDTGAVNTFGSAHALGVGPVVGGQRYHRDVLLRVCLVCCGMHVPTRTRLNLFRTSCVFVRSVLYGGTRICIRTKLSIIVVQTSIARVHCQVIHHIVR